MVAERENIQVTEEKELLQQRTQGSRNEMEIVFDAVSCNESFARVAVAAFITHLNPTLEELADIKTAVSEAVTNAIIHGYENLAGYSRHGESIPAYSIVHPGKVRMHCVLDGDIRERESRILRKPWNLYLPRNRNWIAPAWGLLLWKLLWTTWR